VGFAYAQMQPQTVAPTYLLADESGAIVGHVWEPEAGVFVSDLAGLEVCCDCNPQVTPGATPVTPEPSIEPTKKASCNRGIGNNSEGCDPGNSYGQGQGQGRQAGEDRNENHPDNNGDGKNK